MRNYQQESMSYEKRLRLGEYWGTVLKRKWTVFAFAAPLFAIVTILSFVIKPTYTARGTLLIEKEPNILSFEEVLKIESYNDDYYQTQYKLLQSRALAANVIERLKLTDNPEFVGEAKKRNARADKSDPAFRSRLIDNFLSRINITPLRQTRLVEVSFKDHDPNSAATVVNALFDSFIDMNIEARYEATEQATEFLTSQISGVREEIEKGEKELQKYGAEKNIIALSDKETTIVEKLGELNKALTEAQIDRLKKETNYNQLKLVSADYIPEALNNELIQRLREDYVKLDREYLKMQEKFKPDYPEMQRLKTELESAKKSLENETQNLIKGAYSDYQGALSKEQALGAVFNRQKQEAIQLNSNAILYNSLKIEVENKKNLLESLLRRQSETGVSARLKGLRTSNVRVVDRAEAPLFASSPKKRLNIILALILGLFGGVFLAFVFEYLDDSVKNAEDIEKNTRLPVLGIIPEFRLDHMRDGHGQGGGEPSGRAALRITGLKKGGHRHTPGDGDRTLPSEEKKLFGLDSGFQATSEASLTRETGARPGAVKSIELIVHLSPQSIYSECYRSIRTSMLLSSVDSKLRTIAVSSPLPMEGKTVTVSNLAVTLAQTGKEVLIVDSDLRKPRQHRLFEIKNLNGLTNYLTTNIEIKDLLKETRIPNLSLINAGPVPPNPAELLGSEKVEHLIIGLKEFFDYILFDLPPILTVTDATIMGSKIDAMILVVRGEKTPKAALIQAKEKLDLLRIKTLGVIINDLTPRQGDYSYRHQYYGEH